MGCLGPIGRYGLVGGGVSLGVGLQSPCLAQSLSTTCWSDESSPLQWQHHAYWPAPILPTVMTMDCPLTRSKPSINCFLLLAAWAIVSPQSTRTITNTLWFLILFYVYGCFACMYVRLCLVHGEAWRGHQVPWNWSYRQLWAAMWVLGIEPRPFRRATNTLNCWTISPVRVVSQSS